MADAKQGKWKRRLSIAGGGLVGALALGWLFSWPDVPPAVANAYPETQLPEVADEDNAYLVYVKGGKAIRFPERVGAAKDRAAKAALLGGIDSWKSEMRPAIAALVKQNAGPLEALREGRKMPRLQVAPPGHTFMTPLPTFVGVQDLARVGVAEMRLSLAAARHEAALQRAVDLLSLGRRMTYAYDDPIITELVGLTIARMPQEALRAEQGAIAQASTPVLRTFLKELNALDSLERPIEQFMLGERNSALRSAPLLARGSDMGPFGPMMKTFPVAERYQTYARNVFDLQMERVAARDWKGQHAVVDQYTKVGVREFAAVVFHPADGAARMLGAVAMPSFQGAAEKILRTEAQFDALRIQVASELYRRDHGKAPARLEDLKAAGLPAVPSDPFKPQQPLQFADGRLWSVGWDGVDEQGKKPQGEQPLRNEGGDLLL